MALYDFSDKVVIVTGPTGMSLGKEIAKRFFLENAQLAICSRSLDRVEETKKEIGGERADKIFAAQADMSKPNEVGAFVQAVIKHFGKVDVLVNNAGITRRKPSLEVTQLDWDMTNETKVRGYFFCSQAVIADMVRRGEPGCIINIGSPNAYAMVSISEAAYAAANAGVMQMTRSLAREFGPYGIRVNCIEPGSTPTGMNYERYQDTAVEKAMCDMIPLRRRGKQSDIAELALFLASDRAAYITGTSIAVDGGLSLCCG